MSQLKPKKKYSIKSPKTRHIAHKTSHFIKNIDKKIYFSLSGEVHASNVVFLPS